METFVSRHFNVECTWCVCIEVLFHFAVNLDGSLENDASRHFIKRYSSHNFKQSGDQSIRYFLLVVFLGSECTLYSPDVGSSYVPLFSEYRNFLNVEILLEKTVFFHFLGVNTSCTAGNIYEYDWHGHKRFYHYNRCPNILKMTSINTLHYLNVSRKIFVV